MAAGAVTGVETLDSVCIVLLRTSMFIGGFMAFIMDNLIPGRLLTSAFFLNSIARIYHVYTFRDLLQNMVNHSIAQAAWYSLH